MGIIIKCFGCFYVYFLWYYYVYLCVYIVMGDYLCVFMRILLVFMFIYSNGRLVMFIFDKCVKLWAYIFTVYLKCEKETNNVFISIIIYGIHSAIRHITIYPHKAIKT